MAINNNGSLSFELQLKMAQFKEDAKRASQELSKLGKTAEDEGKRIDNSFSNIGRNLSSLGILVGAQQLVKEIVRVRGEFQKLDVAFSTMLGSQEKATALMNQLVRTAATTPFGLQDVAGGAKQLLAYGMEAEKINETLIRLGDIAAGLSIPLGDMTYLFGTTMVQGRMYTQDLNQFVGRGIPLIKEFAEQFGVAESEVKNLVTEGKIGFPELEKAIMSMTSEGGQFAGLMEAQSKTIAGQVANLEDAIESMFNSIGTDTQDIISGTLTAITNLVENYEKVGKVLLSLVGVYGVYKTAVIAMTAIQTAQTVAVVGVTKSMMLYEGVVQLVAKAQRILNATMLTNPYVLVATAIAGVVAYLIQMKDKTEESQRVLNEAIAETNKALGTEIDKLDNLKKKLEESEKGSEEWKKAKDAIVSQYGKYLSNLDAEIEKTGTLASTYDSLTTAVRKSVAARGLQKFYDENAGVLGESQNTLADTRKKLVEKYGEAYVEQNWKAVTSYLEKGAIKDLDAHMRNAFPEMGANEAEYGKLVTQSFFGDKGDADGLMGELRVAITTAKNNNEQFYANLENFAKANNINVDEMNEILYGIKNDKVEETTTPTTTPTTNKEAEDQAKKEAERKLKLQQQLADDLLQMQQDNEQREIDLKEEGTAKRLAQINHDFEVRRKEIEKQEKEWKKQNIEAGVTTEENGLTKEQSDALADAYAQNVRQQAKAQAELRKEEQQAMRDYLKEYGKYQEKRLAITEDYAERIKKAQNEGEIKTLEAERDKALADLDTQATKTTSAIGKLFADMSGKSIAEMRKIAKDGQEALDFIREGKWDAAKGLKLNITEEMFKNFKYEDIEQIRQAIEQLTKSADDCEVGFAKMKTSWEDFVKAKNPKELQEALQGIIDGVNDYMDVASFASDVIGGLGEAFDSDALKGIAEGINVAMGAVNAASQGAQAGSMFGPIGAAAGAAIGLISSLAQSIAEIYDKKKEKQIQALEDDIHDLEIAYDDLGRAIDKAYSTDASKMIAEQNRMLEEQQRLIREQMQLEEDKKNTDDERLKQWEDELHDIDNQIADNKEAAVDAIFGEDIQSAIENFADAYVGAWSDGSVKVKDIVRQMMQNMVKESIKATLQSSKAMEEIRQKMREFYADNEFQNWEQQELYKMAEEYQKQLDKDYAWAEDLFKDTTAQQASNGGFQAMSQDTGSELNGRFTTMVELQSLQLDKVRSLAIDTATISQNISEMRNLSLLSIGYLESIAKSNNELYQMNYRLGKIEENTSRL
jgi:tape measure domain-containing protein